MIEIVRSKHHHWRNRQSPHPVLTAELALNEAAGWTTAALTPAQRQVLTYRFGHAPRDGDVDAATLVAALAQTLQLIGDTASPDWGVVARDSGAGTARLYFACGDPFYAGLALTLAVRLVSQLSRPGLDDEQTRQLIERTVLTAETIGLDQSTVAMLRAAERRGIPWHRVNGVTRHIQLGHGIHQRRLRETMTDRQSALGRELARNKVLALDLLSQIGLPVGRVAAVRDAASARRAAEAIGYPVVLKPAEGSKGRDVHVGLRSPAEVEGAFASASAGNQRLLLQSLLPGEDHRLLVVEGALVAAARRIPASVLGDGRNSVVALVAQANEDPRRGTAFEKPLNRIVLDEETDRVLASQDLLRTSVPPPGQTVRLRRTANISTGGTAIDVTARVHPDNAQAAVDAAAMLGTEVAGVDFICPDIARSWRETGGGICEVNLMPGLRPHLVADPAFDGAASILRTLFPEETDGRIPTALITGTKGKTTTTLMLGAILAAAGHEVGIVTTEGVSVGRRRIADGDWAGAPGASMVMRHPAATAAVLETARGGLIKSGIYLDRCDVAALLNVDREQIGIDGIDSVDDMAKLKRKVIDTATRAAVLNADDPRCAALAADLPAGVRAILFSLDAGSPVVTAHRRRGGTAAAPVDVDGKRCLGLLHAETVTPLLPVAELPSTMGGLICANVANALAAVALAHGLDVDPAAIAAGLRGFVSDMETTLGRFNLIEMEGIRVLFDRAAQAPSFAAAIPVTDALGASARRICVTTTAGNRADSYFDECAAAIAGHFDDYICYERADYLRGRAPGEIAARLRRGLIAAGVEPARIVEAGTTAEAATAAAGRAAPGDLVAVFTAEVPGAVEVYRAAFRAVSRAPKLD